MEEHWTSVRGGALLALHRDVKGERMLSWEFLRVQATPEGTFYFASPRSKPPVAFKLKELGERRVVFENPEHDFPQRILYWLDAAGAMHARIEGSQGGKTRGAGVGVDEGPLTRPSGAGPEPQRGGCWRRMTPDSAISRRNASSRPAPYS